MGYYPIFKKKRALRNTANPSVKTENNLEYSRLFFPAAPQVAELPKSDLQERLRVLLLLLLSLSLRLFLSEALESSNSCSEL